jgi:uncharacterized protein
MKKCLRTVVVLMAMTLVFSMGCQKVKDEPDGVNDLTLNTNEQAQDAGESIAVMTPGTVTTIAIGTTDFSVEVAKTDEERAHGLMGRESLAPKGGMWFVFPGNVQDEFWMKDTIVALDIIYVDENMKVVHINPNTVPESTEMLSSPVEYRYVLEVPAGSAEKFDIKVGDVAEERIGPQ